MPVKCVPFPGWSDMTLALVRVWAHEELTMLLEIYKELQKGELSARIIGCRVGLPVKCLPFPSWSGLALALIRAWAHKEVTMFLEIYKLLQQAEVSARIIGCRVGLPVKCLPFPGWSDMALALV